ncbi:hypothetical protein OIO90_005423 [Microbotryomycetes sp. JL221]|nr:hypothetical protein OIO90_005423 [Microbotryomycetes sp. JL221]
MSRHRAVKNLDLDDELDDQALDSGGDDYYDDMTDEQHGTRSLLNREAQMASGLAAVQQVLGPATPISDRDIRDALWDSYFDVDGTIAYLLDEQHKREAAKAKTQDMDIRPDAAPTRSMAAMSLGPRRGCVRGSRLASRSSRQPPAPQQPELAENAQVIPTPSHVEHAPPRNKLASKMAANRAARLSDASLSTKSTTPPQMSGATADTDTSTKNPSKLRQKMQAAKAARSNATSSAPKPVSEPSAAIGTLDVSGKVSQSMDVAMSEAQPSTPVVLLAAPSPFASALVSAKPFPLSHEAARIEKSLTLTSAAAASSAPNPGGDIDVSTAHPLGTGTKNDMRARFGPSPDDKVLEARKGTALGAKEAKRR